MDPSAPRHAGARMITRPRRVTRPSTGAPPTSLSSTQEPSA